MEMKASNMHFQRKDCGIDLVVWRNLCYQSMDHDNICNMDQAIFFYFYLRKFNCWIGFAAYFIHAVEKGKER